MIPPGIEVAQPRRNKPAANRTGNLKTNSHTGINGNNEKGWAIKTILVRK